LNPGILETFFFGDEVIMAKNVRDEFERWETSILKKTLSKTTEREPVFNTTS